MGFTTLIYDGYYHGYYSTCKLQNSQTAAIFFFKHQLSRGIEYRIAFAISNKRKYIQQWIEGKRDILTDKVTGKGDLEGLLWAKNQMIEFEQFICGKHGYGRETTICVNWTDNRRRNVYEHYLTRIGYVMGFRNGNKCLFKKVREESD